MRKALALALAGGFILASLARGQAAPDYYVIPMKADPPIVVDGDLSDWANVPCALTLKDKSHVTFGTSHWNGPEDLSAVIHLAWRADTLYVAAEVTDDHVVQPLTGADFWKADHVSVLLDFTPGANPAQTMLGAGQAHIGLSPGDLNSSDPKPEVFIWHPTTGPVKDARIVSRKTATGYVIEASIPFAGLGLKPVAMYQDANFEVFVSKGSDSATPTQEMLMTIGTQPWKYNRARLLPVVFGDGNGKGKAPVRSVSLLDKGQVEAGKKLEVAFDAPAISAGKDPYVFFEARIQSAKAGGFRSRSLRLEVNGKPVEGKRISNRPVTSMTMGGKEANFIAPDGFMTMPYAPNGKSFDESSYGLIGVKGCEFEYDLAGLVTEGKNTLTFANECKPTAANPMLIAVERVELRVKAPPAPPPPPKEAPTGPLTICEPAAAFPKTISYSEITQDGGTFTFTVCGEGYTVASEFTGPDGKWHTASTPSCEYRRKMVRCDEWIEVSDTFKNLTQENLPIMHRHRLTVSARPESFALAGLSLVNRTGRTSSPQNPTAFLATAKSGAGLVALDDVFRVHGREAVQDDALVLSDEELVLKPGVEYTAEWLIVPVAKPDLWAFVNATRRQMDANFPIKYMFAFTSRMPKVSWPDEQFKRYLDYKAVDLAVQSLYMGTYKGRVPQGLAFNEMPEKYNYFTDFLAKLKQVYPDGRVKHGIYYHCFLDVIDENEAKFKDCWITDAAGNHLTYGGEAWLKLYLPTLDNAWGKAIAQGIDIRLDTIKTQCIYWDEFAYSSAKYTYNTWDGWTGDIDAKTFQLKKLKASVHLAAMPFLVCNARRIMDRVPLICNGAPESRTTARLKYENFVETGSISNCRSTLLASPIALGDHLTEKTEQDCYNVMLKALDNGCLYAWYSDAIVPAYPTLASHMFPFTPIELHEGWIVGKERILSNRSGLFGWGDASDFKWFVYDREGKATDGHEVKKITQDGKTYAEVRLPEGYSVAIVREQ